MTLSSDTTTLATAATLSVDVRIRLVVRMAERTVRLRQVAGLERVAAQRVLPHGHDLHVVRVDAVADAAQVIDD